MKLTPTITIDHLDVKIEPDVHSRLRWKEYQLLSLLVEHSPHVVTREELINNIWKGTYCSDSTINQTIKSIRQKLGDNDHKIIRTVPRVGYIIEENQRVNIIFDKEMPKESTIPNTLAQDTPAMKSQFSQDELLDTSPILSFSSHSRLSRATTKSTSIGWGELKKFHKSLIIKLFQMRNKLFILLLIIFMLMIIFIYIISCIKISLFPYALEWQYFNNRSASVTLICPLGFSDISKGS